MSCRMESPRKPRPYPLTAKTYGGTGGKKKRYKKMSGDFNRNTAAWSLKKRNHPKTGIKKEDGKSPAFVQPEIRTGVLGLYPRKVKKKGGGEGEPRERSNLIVNGIKSVGENHTHLVFERMVIRKGTRRQIDFICKKKIKGGIFRWKRVLFCRERWSEKKYCALHLESNWLGRESQKWEGTAVLNLRPN